MSPLHYAGFWLGILSAILAGLLAGRMFASRLFKIYPVLMAFLIFDSVRTLVRSAFPPRSTRAAYLFVATEPIAWIFYFLLIREIFQIVLRDHNGIATVSRRFVAYAFAISAAASVALVWMEIGVTPGVSPVLQITFLFDRVAIVALVALLLAGLTFMSWFPVAITRNAAALVTGYAVYFSAKGILLLARNLAGNQFTLTGGVALLCIYVTCLALGIVLIRSQNESRRQEYRVRADPREAERLLGQLQRINHRLEQSVRP
jgi:hypothetical protein